jgi:MOSC domain-containing protein YiiM
MHLISVNVGKLQTQQNGNRLEETGIFKTPQSEAVRVTTLGLEGDTVVDKKNHGGVDQAVYLYGNGDYEWWANELGYELTPGAFGENLTISELQSPDLNIGDTIRVGEVLLQVSAPRIPCSTLATKMGDPGFVKRFRHAERPGAYCRVIEAGEVRSGDKVQIERYEGETINLSEMFRLYYEKPGNEADIRRILAAPIAIRARHDNEKHLTAVMEKANIISQSPS